MSSFFAWFSRRSGATPKSVESASELLEQARALAREGKQGEASAIYWKIKFKHRTTAGLIEHAELLFALGDHFGSASMASRALELEPENAKAKAIQYRIQNSD